jgi:uncharacterized protein (TIGR03067 family)
MNTRFLVMVSIVCLIGSDTKHVDPPAETGIKGSWQAVSIVCDGEELPPKAVKLIKLTVTDNKMCAPIVNIINDNGKKEILGIFGNVNYKYKVNLKKCPREIDMVFSQDSTNVIVKGIYYVNDTDLVICCSEPGKARPNSFTSRAGSGWSLSKYQREERGAGGGKR